MLENDSEQPTNQFLSEYTNEQNERMDYDGNSSSALTEYRMKKESIYKTEAELDMEEAARLAKAIKEEENKIRELKKIVK